MGRNMKHHPNIVDFLGRTNVGAATAVVMEVGGIFESKILHRIPYRKLNRLLRQVALGMIEIHSIPMVHRDLKSQNILLKNNYKQAAIADFGFAKSKGLLSEQAFDTVLGTLIYQDPEISERGEKVLYSNSCDVYSYGILMWEVLAGQLPYKGLSAYRISEEVRKNGLRPPAESIPENYRDLFKKCVGPSEERPEFSEILPILNSIQAELMH